MTTTEVATTNGKSTLAQLITRMQPEIAKALPAHMNPERMARIATTTLRQTPQLASCTPESFLGALLTASQLGLEPGPIGEAYFVPFNTKTGMVCQFIPGYRGLIKLARNSGQLVDIWAEIVYEEDEFTVSYGLHRDLVHKPKMGADRGKPVYVYAAAELKDGGRPFVVLTIAEVEAIRNRSKASKNGPWMTDWAAMAKKTAVKQLSKWLPLSAEFNTAAVLDGSVRTDVGQLVDVQPDYVDCEVEPSAIAAADEPSENRSKPDNPQVDRDAPSDDEPAEPAGPMEIRMATKQQLAQLKQIRSAEKYGTDADWFAFLRDAMGVNASRDAEITYDDAARVIAEFNEEWV